jgi:hypothetical protein
VEVLARTVLPRRSSVAQARLTLDGGGEEETPQPPTESPADVSRLVSAAMGQPGPVRMRELIGGSCDAYLKQLQGICDWIGNPDHSKYVLLTICL